MPGSPANLLPPFSLTLPVSERVGEALASAVQWHAASMLELQRALQACVGELREQGMLPESSLLTMKALVRHLSKTHPPPGRKANVEAADLLMDQIVGWCIEAYYPDSGPRSTPPDATE